MMNNQEMDSTPQNSFGGKLKQARESLGFSRADVARQLRLSEKIILMMEKDRYATDLPITFIQGYLHAYGKFLEVPTNEIDQALEPIKAKHQCQESARAVKLEAIAINPDHRFMHFVTYLITLTVLLMVAIWWITHHPKTLHHVENIFFNLTEVTPPPRRNLIAIAEKPLPPIPEKPQVLANNENIDLSEPYKKPALTHQATKKAPIKKQLEPADESDDIMLEEEIED